MTNLPDVPGTSVFRPRTSVWFTALALMVVAIGLVSSVVLHGAAAGIAGSWPLIVIAYVAWWLFWYPRIEVGSNAIVLRNPLHVVTVPWEALIDVDTRFAMKLVTPRGSYTAWAAPAPGIIGTHRGRAEHVRGLPATTYGPAQSVRPGDLKNTDSGAAAYLVRSRWEELVSAGSINVDSTETAVVRRTFNVVSVLGFVILVTAGLLLAPLFF